MRTQRKSVAVPIAWKHCQHTPWSSHDSLPPRTRMSCVRMDLERQVPGTSGCHTFRKGMHWRQMTRTVARVIIHREVIVTHSTILIFGCVSSITRKINTHTEILTRQIPMPFCIITRVVYMLRRLNSEMTYLTCLPNPCLTCKVLRMEP